MGLMCRGGTPTAGAALGQQGGSLQRAKQSEARRWPEGSATCGGAGRLFRRGTTPRTSSAPSRRRSIWMITCEAKRSGVWKRMRARPGMCDREMGGERQRRQGGGCGRGGAIVGPQATAERPPRHTRFAHLHLRGRAPPDGPPVVADPDGRRVVGRVAAAARRAVSALVDAHVPHAQRRREDLRLLARGELAY